MRANTGVTSSLGVLEHNAKNAPSSKLNKCKESNRTLSSLKNSQAAVSRRIVSGTSQRSKSLRDEMAGNWEPPHHLFQVLELFQQISQTMRQFL